MGGSVFQAVATSIQRALQAQQGPEDVHYGAGGCLFDEMICARDGQGMGMGTTRHELG